MTYVAKRLRDFDFSVFENPEKIAFFCESLCFLLLGVSLTKLFVDK